MSYDVTNVFARILRGEIPCDKVYEDEFALAFRDIHPVAPVHVLVVPKGEFVTLDEFAAGADPSVVVGFWRAFARVIDLLGVERGGYRTIVNTGPDGGQEVPHLHFHVVAGAPLGRMVSRAVRP
jgi:histidine triad (HIT) family protein